MKLRIQGNSIRLRVSRSELAAFAETGRLEETVYFGPQVEMSLTYALVRDESLGCVSVSSAGNEVSVLVPAASSSSWSSTEQVGISGEVDLGMLGTLSVLVEKDFACLDRGDEENADTFPNPLAAHVC